MKMSRNVVVTGFSLVIDKGFEAEKIWNNLYNTQCAGTLDAYCDLICPIDFKKRFLDLTPCSTYGFSAAELAWRNAFKGNENINRERWGVYNGTAFGSFTGTVHAACQEYIKNGPAGLLPGIFNNKSCNVTADIIAISHKLMGANTTFMSGRLASGMALMQAFDDVMDEELQGAVVIGTEAIDNHIVKGHEILGEENTDLFASGACSIILQALEDIDPEKTVPSGYIRAVEAAGHGREGGYYSNKLPDSLRQAMESAVGKAGIGPEDIDIILSGQGKSEAEAASYHKAIGMVFGKKDENRVFHSKSVLGDSLGAFPAMNTALGLMLLERQAVPFKAGAVDKKIKYVLATADDPDGNAWALVLERFTGV